MTIPVETIFATAESYRQLGMTQMYQNLDQARTFLNRAQESFDEGLNKNPNSRWGRAHLGATQRSLAPLTGEVHYFYRKSADNLLHAALSEPPYEIDQLEKNPDSLENTYPWAWAQLGQTLTWMGLYQLYTDVKGVNQANDMFQRAEIALNTALRDNERFALALAEKALLEFFWGMTLPGLYPNDNQRGIRECGEKLSASVALITQALEQVQDWAWGLAWQSQIFQVNAIYHKDFGKQDLALDQSLDSMNQFVESTLINSNLIPVVSLWALICPDGGDPIAMAQAPLSHFLAAEELYFKGQFQKAREALRDVFSSLKD